MKLFYVFQGVEYYDVTHKVTFTFSIAGEIIGDVEIGLFGNIVPQTVKNFYTMATEGIEGRKYAGSKIHRVVRNLMIQGGDVVYGNGEGLLSIFGGAFPDESFKVLHNQQGIISMANAGPNTNGCQFFISSVPAPWVDGKHVAFGKVLSGMSVVEKIAVVETTYEETPLKPVIIEKSSGEEVKGKLQVASDPNNLWDILKSVSFPIAVTGGLIGLLQWMSWQMKC